MSCNSAVILPKSRTCNAKLSRTCSWVKFPCSSSTFNPSSPKMILSLWADVLVCRNIRQCSLNVLLHSAARNELTTRQYKVLSLFRPLPAISAPPPPFFPHLSECEGRTNRKWYNLIHICKYRRTANWEASVFTVSADRTLYALSEIKNRNILVPLYIVRMRPKKFDMAHRFLALTNRIVPSGIEISGLPVHYLAFILLLSWSLS